MKNNSNELLGKYDGLADGRLDIDFRRDSCLNKDGRKEERERKKKWLGKKNLSKEKNLPTLSIWVEDDRM